MAWATAPPWPTWDSLTSLSWQDPRLVWAVAFFAVFMLVGAWLLGRRRKGKKLNRGAVICGVISVMLHVLLIALLPFTKREGGSGAIDDRRADAGAVARVNVSAFSDLELSDSAASNADDSVGTAVPPLPVDAGMELITDAPEPEDPQDSETHEPELPSLEESPSLALPSDDQQPTIDDAIDSWLVDAMVAGDIANDPEPEIAEAVETEAANGEPNQNRTDVAAMTIPGTVGNTV
ncbi:MAG: hypothetical protein KDB00_01910, partial [Planctomycetales bacterium]|nr:hypothetical protein [Planctomycetales bacterium]